MERTEKLNLYKWNQSDQKIITIEESAKNVQIIEDELNKQDSKITETAYYDEINYASYRDEISGTDYYITYVPNTDKNGKLIKLEHGYQNDQINSGVGETARNFAKRKAASFVTNASAWTVATGIIRGVQIKDGVILQEQESSPTLYTLGIKADNTLVMYPPSRGAASILSDGCVNALTGFFPMIENGVAVDPTVYSSIPNTGEKNPRSVIAQMPNKDLLFFSCDGRTSRSAGMTYVNVIDILLARGVKTAYCLDGGGSTQHIVRNVMVNLPIDDSGLTERLVMDFLYIKKDAQVTGNMVNLAADLGNVNKKLTDQTKRVTDLADIVGGLSVPSAKTPYSANLNSIRATGPYWSTSGTLNVPVVASVSSWGIFHFQVNDNAALQFAVPYHSTLGNMKRRRTVTNMDDWTAWSDV